MMADALDRLISYYQLNGYEAVDKDSEEASEVVCLQRGVRGAGWYSSEMTALFTELEIEVEGDEIVLRYAVDVKGQRLNSGDRAFWGQEARHAKDVASGNVEAVDLRPVEAKRVAKALKRFYLNGVWFTIIFVLFVLLLILLGVF